MATKTKAKRSKTSKAKSAVPIIPVSWPVERSRWETDQEYFPKVGDDIGLTFNENPFWEEPNWKTFSAVEVLKIRDLAADPLSPEEFANFVTANVGRYLIDCNWTIHYAHDKDVGQCQFFWNDCQIDTYWDKSQADPNGCCDFQIDPDSPSQPYRRSSLQIVARVGDAWIPVATFGISAEDRLLMVAKLRDLTTATKNSDVFGVRPVV